MHANALVKLLDEEKEKKQQQELTASAEVCAAAATPHDAITGNHRIGPSTERLELRAFQASDAEAYYRLNSNPEVMRYLGGESLCADVDTARAAIINYPDWELYNIGRWAAVLRETGEVIGFAGLKYLPEFDHVDLGYRLLPEHWGKGLATEAARACLRYGFESLGLSQIVGYTDPQNEGSQRVLQKVGMERQEPVLYYGYPSEYFLIDAERYQQQRNS